MRLPRIARKRKPDGDAAEVLRCGAAEREVQVEGEWDLTIAHESLAMSVARELAAADASVDLAAARGIVSRLEARGMLALEKRRYDVVVDDPDLERAYHYFVSAPSPFAAACAAAREACRVDPHLWFCGQRPGNEHLLDDAFRQSDALIESVAMYATVRLLAPR